MRLITICLFVGAVSALATARRLDGWRGGSSLTRRQDGGEEPPTGSQPPLGEEATTDTAEPTDADETEGDGSEDSDDSDGTTKSKDCNKLMKKFDFISCEANGTFSPRQCKNGRCFCVDTETGKRIEDIGSFPANRNVSCENITDLCPGLENCFLSCIRFKEKKGCRICQCDDFDDDDDDSDDTDDDSSDGEARCEYRVPQLVRDGCAKGCIVRDENGCPVCNSSCDSDNLKNADECESDEDCEEDQECILRGSVGIGTCIDLLGEGEECRGEGGKGQGKGRGRQRMRAGRFGSEQEALDLNEAVVPCKEGLVCTQVGLDERRCRPEDPAGPCVSARDSGEDSDAVCAEDGTYYQTQCRRQEEAEGEGDGAGEGSYYCYCVYPNGTQLEGSHVSVSCKDDIPRCNEVFASCTYEVDGIEFTVPHGKRFINLASCQTCQCNNGEAVFCRDASPILCSAISPADCVYGNTTYSHGDTFRDDCNVCGCRNGRISCTQRSCEQKGEINGTCEEYRTLRRRPVCAVEEGRTYPSRFYAVNCAGVSNVELITGPCQRLGICNLYPCPEGQRCMRKGGVSCFNQEGGCSADDLRKCVDLNELQCDEDDEEEEEEEEEEEDEGCSDLYVCGTDGKSYRSRCHLYQQTGNVEVAHIGRCEKCTGGPVCGTDGLTYENICTLRSQLGVHLDYEAECVSCDLVVGDDGLCEFDSLNCEVLAESDGACCPICGGVVSLIVDEQGLAAVDAANFGDYVDDLFDELPMLEMVSERCEVDLMVGPGKGQITIYFSARDPMKDAYFCNQAANNLTNAINLFESSTPQSLVLNFAAAAVSAPVIPRNEVSTEEEVTQQSTATDDNGEEDSGARNVAAYSSAAFVSLLLFAHLLFA